MTFNKKKYWILFVLAGSCILLDQVTKYLIIQNFRLGETLPIISGIFNLTYVRNTGAAFGLFAQAHPAFRVPFFVLVPAIALVAIAYVFKKIPEGSTRLAVALSLVVGGAVGNLIDRVILGYVVDFVLFHWQYRYHFPAFNVADTAICVGVGLLMLDLLAQDSKRSKEANASTTS